MRKVTWADAIGIAVAAEVNARRVAIRLDRPAGFEWHILNSCTGQTGPLAAESAAAMCQRERLCQQIVLPVGRRTERPREIFPKTGEWSCVVLVETHHDTKPHDLFDHYDPPFACRGCCLGIAGR
ncbi:MAG: hypothetical protein AAF561_12535, partial [Planctomycetota bacterium]